MNAKLDDYLVQKYPKIFIDRYESMQKTAMCWGFEHGDGWFWILDQLCNSIQSYIDYNSKKTVIKNKFARNLTKRLRTLSFKQRRGTLLRKIANYIDDRSEKIEIETIPQVVATQVKEKFGTLNFYYDGGNDYIDGMISLSEHMSSNVCEFCGTTENVGYTSGWISTICKDCHTNSGERISNRTWQERKSALPTEISTELRKIKLDKLNNKDLQ